MGSKPPGSNDRLVYMRRLLERQGHSLFHAVDRAKLRHISSPTYCECSGSSKATIKRSRLGDPGIPTLYSPPRAGCAFDTALFPNYAVEEALKVMRTRGLLKAVKRAAVIGPGLDFADKQGGYDPEQTLVIGADWPVSGRKAQWISAGT